MLPHNQILAHYKVYKIDTILRNDSEGAARGSGASPVRPVCARRARVEPQSSGPGTAWMGPGCSARRVLCSVGIVTR